MSKGTWICLLALATPPQHASRGATAAVFARLIAMTDAPVGLVNVLAGSGEVGEALVRDARVALVTFTGSVAVGKTIRREAGLKRVTLELGANCGVIIEPDADLNVAVSRCIAASFAHSGQICTSLQRIFAHRDVFDEVVARIGEQSCSLKIGHPLNEETELSSLITRPQAVRVESWIRKAARGGAKICTGGTRENSTVFPTVLTDVERTMDVSCKEVFGPIVSVTSYEKLDDAVELLNDSPYGLQSGLFTQDISRALNAAARIETGGVMINEVPMFRVDHMPYGGMKDSGMGREGPAYAIQEMTESKLVTINLAAHGKSC